MNNRHPLVPIVHASEPPSASEPGVLGHGEGICYGFEPASRRPAIYYYRFAGKSIPTHCVTYVTCEYGFFSRERGDKTQLILAYDLECQAFRVLAQIAAGDGTFKSTLAKYQSFRSNADAIAHAQLTAEAQKKAQQNLQDLINSGADLF